MPRIVGRPLLPGTIGNVKIRATDPHGAWTESYLTIKIEDLRVTKRDDRVLRDFEVVERKMFSIKLRDDLFYDRDSGWPLVVFATDMA